MNILVTGCAGFIGAKVTELLLAEGHRVLGIDNLDDSYDVSLKERRLGLFRGRPGFEFRRASITDPIRIEGMDAIVHLAARAGVRRSVEQPAATFDTNLGGTLRLLDLCRDAKIGKFVLASTSSVYGRAEGPFREDMPANRPLSPYAASKKAAETLAYAYHHLYGIDVTVLRYFTVYGPAGRPDMSVFRFIRWVVEGDPVQIFGDGAQTRDYTYVEDIARGTMAALKPVGYEVFNLGSDRPAAVTKVLGLVERFAGKRASVERSAAHPADVPATWADVSKAKAALGWTPLVSLEKGLEDSVRWYQKNRDWAKELKL